MSTTPRSRQSQAPRDMKAVIRALLAAVVLLVIGWYLYTHGDDFLLLREFDLRFLPIMLAVPVAAIVINGRILKLLVAQLGVDLEFKEWFGLTVLHAFGNYLPIPQGGSIARGVYLKKTRGLDYASFTATVVVTYVEFLSCTGFVGLLLGAWMGIRQQSLPWPFWLLFAALAALVLVFLPVNWPLSLAQKLQTFRDALVALRARQLLLRVAALQLSLIGLNMVALWLAFASLGRPVSATASALLSLISMTSGVINVTPGNVGVAESAAWLTAEMTGGDAHVAVVAFTVFRLMAVLVIFALTPVFVSRLSTKVGAGSDAENEPRKAETDDPRS